MPVPSEVMAVTDRVFSAQISVRAAVLSSWEMEISFSVPMPAMGKLMSMLTGSPSTVA